MASLIEVVDFGNRMFFQTHAKKGTKAPNPIQVPRPGDAKQKKQKATPEQMRRFFGRRLRVVKDSDG